MGIRAVRARAILNQQFSANPQPTQQLSVDVVTIPRSAEPAQLGLTKLLAHGIMS